MQLFDLKLTYIIESDIYKLGDLTIEFSKIYLSSEINKPKFFFVLIIHTVIFILIRMILLKMLLVIYLMKLMKKK